MAIRITCSKCGKTLEAPDELAGKRARCAACGNLVAVPAIPLAQRPILQDRLRGAGDVPAAPPAAPPVQRHKKCPFCSETIQADAIKCKHCGEFLERPAPRARFAAAAGGPAPAEPEAHSLRPFPTAVVVLLHVVTIGIFTAVWLNLMHGKMPKIRRDDPSAGKAIGFLFIPFFNFYWVFFTYHRLCVRINEARAQAGLAADVPAGLAITMCVLIVIGLIPGIGLLTGLVNWLFVAPIFAGIVQSRVNELVNAPRRRYVAR